jgi:ABC-2 type transport system permease protein
MNVFNRFFLFLLLLPSALYRKMGVDIPKLKAILNIKLVMDDRRPPAIRAARKNQKPSKLATIGTMILSAFLGCVYLMAFGVGNDRITQLSVYFSFYVFVLASMLISDFTSVLIDVRDNFIILPKPINDSTFLLSRLLHIVIYICKLIVPMTIPGMIFLGVTDGITGFASFALLVIAATLFTVFLVNAVYVLILKITTPEKFKNIISYFQIFFAILIYGGYQIVPRLVGKAALSAYSITGLSWNWTLPPYWFAAGWQYIRAGDITSPLVIYLILSLLVPVASVWLVIRFFAPSFNQKLSMISGSEGGNHVQSGKKIVSTTSLYVSSLSRWLTRKGVERMSFLHAWKISSRSRDFKMKVYPSIGYMFVYIVFFAIQTKGNSLTMIREQPSLFLFLLYLTGYTSTMAIYQLVYSDKFKAAWIYYITPIGTPGNLISGALKAILIRFMLPVSGFVIIAGLVVTGPGMLIHVVLGICNQVLVSGLIAYVSLKQLPFSQAQTSQVKGGNFLTGLFSLLIPLAFGFMHFFVFKYTVAVIILCLLSGTAAWLVMDAIHNKSWEKIRMREYEG